MANREENLKKINVELEKLSDEELEQVAGGSIPQTSEDSKFLYKHGLTNDWHGVIPMTFKWGTYSKEVDDGWAKAGITCVTNPSPFKDNLYFKDGKPISRTEAYNIVEKNFKRVREVEDQGSLKFNLGEKKIF